MHRIEQMCGRIGRPAPVVCRFPMRELFVNFARMDRSSLSYKFQNEFCPFPAHSRDTVVGARMHQLLYGAEYKPIVDKEIFADVQLLVLTLEVACSIVFDS